MAKVPIAEVKQTWAAALRALPALANANLHAAWPGDQLLYDEAKRVGTYKAAIWFGPSTPVIIERHAMRATRQLRMYTVAFEVIVEVLVAGESNDDTATGTNAALRAESYAYDLWQPIDEHIADDLHLSSPTLVELAWVDGEDASSGFTDTGYGFRMHVPVFARFRVL